MKKTLFIVCLTLFLLLAACETPQKSADTSDSIDTSASEDQVSSAEASTEETMEETVPVGTETIITESVTLKPSEAHEDMVIFAAGLEFKYPQKWENKITVSQEDDRVSFSRGDIRLFDFIFNRPNEGILLGTVYGKQNTVITVVSYPLGDGDSEAREMQEDVNDILDHLLEDYDFVAGEAGEIIEGDVYGIPTSVTTFYYPTRWKDRVTVEILTEKVCFSSSGTPLFDLIFSEDSGVLLGYYDGTPISFVEYPVEDEDHVQMKEDVNVILDYLNMDEAFE